MALLTPHIATPTGYVEALVAATATTGDTYVNTGKEAIVVFNDSAAEITVTVDSVTPCEFGVDHDTSVAVAAHTRRVFGPFSPARYGNADTSITKFTCSSVTTVTVGVIR
jgi:hypothetical protein